MQALPSMAAEAPLVPPAQTMPAIVSATQAVTSSLAMTVLFVLGLALIQILFHRATPGSDSIVQTLEYCSMGAGYFLLALPVWGIFDTLRRTHLYVNGPKNIIAFGYICLMGALLYFSYKVVLLLANLLW